MAACADRAGYAGRRVNYRLTIEVANHLKLFDTENLNRPLLAAIGAFLARDIEAQIRRE